MLWPEEVLSEPEGFRSGRIEQSGQLRKVCLEAHVFLFESVMLLLECDELLEARMAIWRRQCWPETIHCCVVRRQAYREQS